jgi:solute carrier family 13 (sodium-dependent dicarboxylate transporter), member 2/3/5
MNLKRTVGLLLGLAGLVIPWFLDIPGLGFAGQVTLGIFVMAACFWVLEPVPIYTTSLLVIFLEVLLLSAEGPLCQIARVDPTSPVAAAGGVEPGAYGVPRSALVDGTALLIERSGQLPQRIEVEVLREDAGLTWVRSSVLSTNTAVVTRPTHWLTSYRPTSYRNFFGALADPIIILFMGGCLLADASVKYRLDRSLTRLFLRPVGTNPSLIVLGLLVATAVLSAFMSNTATTAMMMTVVLPILAKLPPDDPGRRAVVLAIPIGANIGGIATPIGTPPNAIALAAATKQGIHLPFATWVVLALPIVVITLVFAWALLVRLFRPQVREVCIDLDDRFDTSGKAVGLYVVFGLTALLWFTENQHGISSSIVAFLPIVALPMFGIVGKREIHGLPWDVLWLMAGGISLGTAIKDTGLATWMVGQVDWTAMSGFAICAGLALFSFALANFLSHTVTVTLLAPIAISVGVAAGSGGSFSLGVTMVAVAVASSYGMTLPISTPPNAIAMGSGAVETRDMLKAGSVIGVFGMICVMLMVKFYWPLFFR